MSSQDHDLTADAAFSAEPSEAIAPTITPGWQPIETAPKDGEPILATNASYAYTLQRCGVYYWEGGYQAVTPDGLGPLIGAGWMHQVDDFEDPRADYLTHWMPLPEPPK